MAKGLTKAGKSTTIASSKRPKSAITMEKKTITCPKCRGILEVTNPQGQATLLISCPNPQCGAKLRVTFDTGMTQIAQSEANSRVAGYLQQGPLCLKLLPGRNTIGRMSQKHEATLEVTTDDRSVSRLHCQIDVITTSSGRVKAVLSDIRSNEKKELKPTLLGKEPLLDGDRLVLTNGDTITIGNQVLTYYQQEL